MLENSLYTINNKESVENMFRVGISLNAGHEIYKAHFPGNPITPGVCLLQMSLELINSQFGGQFRFIQAKSIKYLKVISPVKNPSIEYIIRHSMEDGLILTDITIQAGDTTFTKISATYKPE